MKARPILMSAPMVRAALEGRKTQTRRIVKPHPKVLKNGTWYAPYRDENFCYSLGGKQAGWTKCPYGKTGDLLWIREAHAIIHLTGAPTVVYAATDQRSWKYKPSIHMPRWASRFTLEITNVRLERLQDISEKDAAVEGYASDGDESARIWYAMLWEKINGEGSWAANPWVWVIDFKTHIQNVDNLLKERAA